MTDLRKAILSHHPKRIGLTGISKPSFAPVKWSDYFQSQESIETHKGRFHIYSTGKTGPILLCLHGGGYSGLTWALFAKEVTFCNNVLYIMQYSKE